MIDLKTIKKVHFVGIGGIGVSAIARMFQAEGKTVSGSDRGATLVTDELEKLGVQIFTDQVADNVPADADLIVYSIAVPKDNPERAKGRELGIPELSYPQVLGLVSRDKFTIAISGTHGKTTTTAMIAKIFIEAGLEPTVIVGSFLKDHQSNFIAGDSKYLIVEACEYQRSFLNLSPNILVITNIEEDHLDYYKDLEDIKNAFRELAQKVVNGGFVVANLNDLNVKDTLKNVKLELVDYTTALTNFELKVPGAHNRLNAQAARKVAEAVGIPDEVIYRALGSFSGTWRRFDYVGQTPTGALVYDDYAHHPSEIQATLAGAREKWSNKKIIVIFQPHLYSRTKLLLNEFAFSFKEADQIFILPIYAAREVFDPSIDHKILAQEIKKNHSQVEAVENFDQVVERVLAVTGPEDVIMTVGAGDIAGLGKRLV